MEVRYSSTVMRSWFCLRRAHDAIMILYVLIAINTAPSTGDALPWASAVRCTVICAPGSRMITERRGALIVQQTPDMMRRVDRGKPGRTARPPRR